MLFNLGDALERVIDLFAVADDVGDLVGELTEFGPKRLEFSFDRSELLALRNDVRDGKVGDVLLCRHVFDDVFEHLADFFECYFFGHRVVSIPRRDLLGGGCGELTPDQTK